MKFIEFTVKNFKTFKDEVTFSMSGREGKFTFKENDENLMKAALIYGPNASGKSTLMLAISYMIQMIQKSEIVSSPLPYKPFMLSTLTKNEPTFFEIIFSFNENIYGYNFSYNKNEILKERLFILNKNGENKDMFSRDGDSFIFSEYFENNWGGIDFSKVTRKEVLLLSKAIRENHRIAKIFDEELKKINVFGTDIIDSDSDAAIYGYTLNKVKTDIKLKSQIVKYLKEADFNIADLKVEEVDIPIPIQLQSQLPFSKADNMKFIHSVFDENKNIVGYEGFQNGDESFGTNKFFSLIGPIIDILDKGNVIFIDELDRSLHPLLTLFIFNLFQDKDINKNNAQLIATTHDITLISSENKDNIDKYQVWFTEKNKYGEGILFCLNDFEGLRNDTEYAIKYLQGRFGALPYISSYNE